MKKGKEGKRELIIKEAKELFIKNGYSETKVEDITRKMGISKGNFYTYFDSKEDVLIEILKEVEDKHRKMIEEIDISKEPKEILRDFFIGNIRLFIMTFYKINPQNAMKELLETPAITKTRNDMRNMGKTFLVKNVVERYGNPMFNIEFMAEFIKNSIEEYLWWKILEGKTEDKENYIEEKKEEIEQIVNFIHNGLLKK